MIQRVLDALNAGDFSAATWDFVPATFTVDTWSVLEPDDENSQTMFLREWLDSVSRFTNDHPDYHFRISNLATTVDEAAGSAETILNVQLSGFYPGVVRSSVASFVFHLMEDGWRPVRHVALPGFDLNGVW